MGIRGLNSLIKKYAPEAITENDISQYKGCKVAIDCSILLYKFKYASHVPNSHIIGIANRIKYYLMNDILPIFIFDGTPPEAKKTTIDKRHAAKEKMYIRLENLRSKIPESDEDLKATNEEIERLLAQLIVIKKKDVDDTKEFLSLSGIPFYNAPEDAEKYCAFLQKNNLVDYTVTDDTDATTFGCSKILKTGISKKIIQLNTDLILDKFEMTEDSFIDFCILAGCDYTECIPQIGPITAFNLIKKHSCIENVLQTINKKPSNFNYETSRNIFKVFNYEIPEKIVRKKCDKNRIIEFLKNNEIKENIISKFIKIITI